MDNLIERLKALSPEKRALFMERLKDKGINLPGQSIRRRADANSRPLSFAQQRLWFLQQLEKDSSFYNIAGAVWLLGDLNLEALQQGLNEIVQRHEVLRCRYEEEDGKPVTVFDSNLHLELPITSFDHLPESERREAALQWVSEQARRPFNLKTEPVIRAVLLRLGPTKHILFVNIHHIAADGWSIGIFIRELSTHYEARLAGNLSLMPDLPVQYSDYAVWQQEQLNDVFEAQLTYWRARLSGSTQVLDLPLDHARPAVQSRRGAHYEFRVPQHVAAWLRTFGEQTNATLFMTLLATFKALLFRYTGQEDISVGTPVANRRYMELEPLIGLFVNTLIIRTDASGQPTFRDLLARVREAAVGAYANQDVPFDLVVERLNPERSLSYDPLCQVMFAVEGDPLDAVELRGLTWQMAEVERGSAKFDLTFTAIEGRDGLRFSIEYATQLFEEATIVRMASNYLKFVESIQAAPDESIANLPLLADCEWQRVIVDWNATEEQLPDRALGHIAIEEQARKTPESIAVVYEGQLLTFAQLNERANQLAHFLRQLSVGPDVIVGICLERSLELVVAVMAVLKAGGAYVPLDPNYPPERLRFMVEDSQARILLTQAYLADELPATGARVVCLDRERVSIASCPESNPNVQLDPANLAYVIYTSGSTGRPKAAMLHHRGLVNMERGLSRVFHLGPDSRMLQFAAFSFDASVLEIFSTLPVGGAVYLAPRERLASAEELIKLLRDQKITTVLLPPSLMRVLSPDGLPDLQTVIAGGEACPREVVQRWAPGRTVINAYGPTEITVCSSVFECSVDDGQAPPIGRPNPNTRLYILDHSGHAVPIGVPGELYIGGIGVARGYLRRPDLTAEKFVPDTFSQVPGARLYRTGDLVRWRVDGTVEFLGRLDEQVKIRGFRIELGEVEAALAAHDQVRECIVVAREYRPGDMRLVAYIVPRCDATPDVRDLCSFVGARLPQHMVPSAIVTLTALPRLPNGKVDRRSLPVPESCDGADVHDDFAACTPMQELVAEIWREILGTGHVSLDANFFEAGGHSLLATQVISRVRKLFGVDLPIRTLFEHPTVRTFSEAVAIAKGIGGQPVPPIRRADRTHDLPLSYAQQRLWFLSRLEPDNPAYNIAGTVSLRGPLDLGAFQQALKQLVQRHECLRAAFVEHDGRATQTILPDVPVALSFTDIRDLSPEDREAKVAAVLAAEAQHVFDLSRPPLFRLSMLRVGEQEHVLSAVMHHVVSDGWSNQVLLRDFLALYEALVSGKPLQLPRLEVQYADYAVWQREWLQGDVLEEHLGYWRNELAGVPTTLDLPTDRPRPALQTFAGTFEKFALSPELTASLRQLAEREGVTLFMALLAAFDVLMARYSGHKDIVVGTPIANRTREQVEAVVGFFVNTLVLRARMEDNPSFRELLQRVRETSLAAYAHQDVPFEMLVNELEPNRDLSRTPLFQVMFSLQNAPEARLQSTGHGGIQVSAMQPYTGTAKFDLSLAMRESAGQLTATLEYSTDLFDPSTIQRMIEQFERLLEEVVKTPDTRVLNIALLPVAERQQLLVDWNRTTVDGRDDCSVQQRIEAQVLRTPEALAVCFENQCLTYAELNRRANRLARRLRKLGAGPDVLVGLALERSVELIVGVLAIWKAGAAYVPLDPAYPPARLTMMAQDAAAPLLVTTERLRNRFANVNAKLVLLDADSADIASESDQNLPCISDPANLAYLIYTSGSTGRPKAVMVQHRSVLNLALGLQKHIYDDHPQRPLRASLNAPLSFDASVQQLVLLMSGHALFVIPDDTRRDAQALLQYIRRTKLDVLDCVPSQLKLLLDEGLLDRTGHAPSIFLPGGEAIDAATWDRLALAPDSDFYNMYGPTECTVDATTCCARLVPQAPSIGHPLCNFHVYVLDSQLEPVPLGVPGELYIGGTGVTRGYLNRPEVTAEKFLPDPFASQAGARLYKTGDLVRWRADGNLEFLGRLDEQVKVRGHRIELGDIEATLKLHDSVRDCVVIAREDSPGQKRLVAYVVPKGQAEGSAQDLRELVRTNLPAYMMPAVFMFVDVVPTLPNGKIDRKNLPAPDQQIATAGDYVAPQTPAEEVLAAIWQQVLGLERVGVTDSFFELGGDSILSIQVVARARQAGLAISAKQLFQNPTVQALASVAEVTVPGPGSTAEQGIVEGYVTLTPVQRWFFAQGLEQPSHFNQSVMLAIDEPLDREALKDVATAIMSHHDALRMRFHHGPDGWLANNEALTAEVPMDCFDLRNAGAEDLPVAIEQAAAQVQAKLDIEQGPLLRIAYLDLGGDRGSRLLLVVHHLVVDGVSWRVLIDDLTRAYGQRVKGEQIKLAAKTTSYRAWSQALHAYAQQRSVAEECDYWREVIRAVPPIPTDGHGDNTEGSADEVSLEIDEETTHALLHDVPECYHTQVQEVLLAALGNTLPNWAGQTSTLVMVEGHGREEVVAGADVSRTVGWFTSLYPVRLTAEAGDWGSRLQHVKEQIRAISGRGIGYGLLRWSSADEQVRAEMSGWTEPEISFNYLGQFDASLETTSRWRLATESSGPDRNPHNRRGFVLDISGTVIGGRVRLEFRYSRNVNALQTIERLANAYGDALRAIVAGCLTERSGKYTPSDFDEEMTQEEVNHLIEQLG